MPSIRRNGVALFYEDVSGGLTPVVLLHGWCCDHTYLAPQLEHFATLGHRVIAPDLRGHGKSDKPVQPYPIAGIADDVAWLLGELGVKGAIVVGHSMGGIIAFDLAARYPSLASSIVMIDSSIIRPSAAHSSFEHFLDGLRGPNYRAVLGGYIASALLLPTDDAKRGEAAIAAMTEAPQHVLVSAFEGMLAYDANEARGRNLPPSLYIAADEPEPRTNLQGLRDLVPDMHYGRTVGSGHFCQLEVPEQVNAMIDRFLAIAAAGSANGTS